MQKKSTHVSSLVHLHNKTNVYFKLCELNNRQKLVYLLLSECPYLII